MSPSTFHVVASFAILFSFLTFGSTAAVVSFQQQRSAEYVGSVDGKDFYADIGTTRNWNDAKAFCETSGLQLATITSAAQLSVIESRYAMLGLNKPYWTGARDSLSEKQFVWDSTGADFDPSGAGFIAGNTVHSALSLYIGGFAQRGIYTLESVSNERYVLCESPYIVAGSQ